MLLFASLLVPLIASLAALAGRDARVLGRSAVVASAVATAGLGTVAVRVLLAGRCGWPGS